MDEEEKPFPIELIVILILVALANDVAEVFFDLLDFTGVGISGEAIMEPANFILDLFFTSIFWWKVGFGGSTITQYIGDLLEPTFIPGRTISVGLGIWLANHPNSAVGKIATQASQLEGGELGALNEAEGMAGAVGTEAEAAKGTLEGEAMNGDRASEGSESKSNSKKRSTGESESADGENAGDNKGGEEESPKKDEMESAEERNPMENLQEQLEEPSNDNDFPKEAESEEEPERSKEPKKVMDINSQPNQQSRNNVVNIADYQKRRTQPRKDDENDQSLEDAA